MKPEEIRKKISKIDRELLVLLQERMGLALRSKKFKAVVSDPRREEDLLARAERLNLDLVERSFTRQLLATIIQESKRLQEEDRKLVAFQGEHGAYGADELVGTLADKTKVALLRHEGAAGLLI